MQAETEQASQACGGIVLSKQKGLLTCEVDHFCLSSSFIQLN
jgi:hypothetical protein